MMGRDPQFDGEWQKPDHPSQPPPTSVHTGGGAYIGQGVTVKGAFIARDKNTYILQDALEQTFAAASPVRVPNCLKQVEARHRASTYAEDHLWTPSSVTESIWQAEATLRYWPFWLVSATAAPAWVEQTSKVVDHEKQTTVEVDTNRQVRPLLVEWIVPALSISVIRQHGVADIAAAMNGTGPTISTDWQRFLLRWPLGERPSIFAQIKRRIEHRIVAEWQGLGAGITGGARGRLLRKAASMVNVETADETTVGTGHSTTPAVAADLTGKGAVARAEQEIWGVLSDRMLPRGQGIKNVEKNIKVEGIKAVELPLWEITIPGSSQRHRIVVHGSNGALVYARLPASGLARWAAGVTWTPALALSFAFLSLFLTPLFFEPGAFWSDEATLGTVGLASLPLVYTAIWNGWRWWAVR